MRATKNSNESIQDPHDNTWHGQVVEFAVWSQLLQQTRGAAHVFLPISDRGVDGIIHLPKTARFIPIQVKGRSRINPSHEIVLDMRGDELNDPDVQIVIIHFDPQTMQMTPTVFVVSVQRFIELSIDTLGRKGLHDRRCKFHWYPKLKVHGPI